MPVNSGFFLCQKKRFLQSIYRRPLILMKGEMEMEKKVYTVRDITQILGISRTKGYEFIQKMYELQKFRVIKIGTSYRIPKESFDAWLNNYKGMN